MTARSGPDILVAGTGFGCRIQVPALRAAGFNPVGLVGTDAERTARRAADNDVPLAFTDLDRAISETGARAVAISTPPNTHFPLVMTALAHGCHVLCEKPFAMDAAEARLMLEAAERAGVVHALGNEFRWAPERVLMARLIADGMIGEPRLATFTQFVQYLADPDVNLPSWWFDRNAGGGWLGASGAHVIDWIRVLLGEFESLSAALPSLASPEGGAEDSFVLRFRLANGTEGTLQQTASAWGPLASMVRVMGTQGTIWLDNKAVWLADREGTREVPIPPESLLAPPPVLGRDPRRHSAEWQMLAAIELAPYVRLCAAWRRAIEGAPPQDDVSMPSFADGLAGMAIFDAVRASAATGGALIRLA